MSQPKKYRDRTGANGLQERDVRESESIFIQSIEQAPVGIYLTDEKGMCTYANETWLKIAGISEEAALGNGWKQGLHPQDREHIFASWQEAIENGQTWDHEYRFLDKDDRVTWVHGLTMKRTDADGNLTGYSGINIDITARVASEKKIRAHANFLDAIMEHSPFAMWIADEKGTVIRTNKTLRDTLNLSDKDIIGKYNILNDRNLIEQGVMPRVNDVFEEKKPTRFSIYWQAENSGVADFVGGKTLWMDVALFPIFDEQGSISNVICKWVDISEQVAATDALRQSQQRYQSVVEDSPVLISRFKPDGTITFTNRAYSQFFTGKDEGMRNANIFDFILKSHLTSAREYLASFTQADPIRKYDDQVKRHDGAKRWLRWIDRALYDQKGNITEYQAFGEDITKQKKYEAALRESKQQYQSVVEDSPGMIIRYHPDGTITYANQNYNRFYIGEDQGFVGRNIYDKYSQKQSDAIRKELAALTPEKPIRVVETRCQRADGNERWIRWTDRALFDQEDQLTGIQAFGEDITEQKKAGLRLAESEKRFRELFSRMNSAALIYETEDDGQSFIIRDINRAGERIGQVKKKDVVGKNVIDVFPGTVKMGLIDAFSEVWKNGTHKVIPSMAYEDKRLSLWVDNNIYKLPSGEIIAVFDDITKRKMAEDKLVRSEARFRAFMENFPGKTTIKDKNLKYIYINQATAGFASMPQEEYIGKTASEIYPPKIADEINELDQSVLDEGIIIQKEGYYQPKSGERRYQREIKFPIECPQDEILVGGITLDLTAQKLAQDRVQQKADFDNLLAQISTDFLNMKVSEIDAGITRALEQVGQMLGLNRIGVSYANDRGEMIISHRWASRAGADLRNSYDSDQYPWLYNAFKQGEIINWSRMQGFPRQLTTPEKEYFKKIDLQSLLSIPIDFLEADFGGIVFTHTQKSHKFSPDRVESLRLFAQVIGNAIVQRDIRSELIQSEQRYRSVVEDAPVLISRYKRDGTIIFANQAYCQFMGRTIDELKGTKFIELMPENARGEAQQRLEKLSQDNPFFTSENRVLNYENQERWVRWTVRCLLNPHSEIEIIQSFGIDITEQRLAAERVAASEIQYRSLFTEMVNGFVLFEVIRPEQDKPEDIIIIEANPAFETLTGLKRKDIIDKPIRDVLPDFDREWIDDYIDVAISGISFHRKDYNQRLGIHTEIQAFSPRHGQCAVILTDVTQQENLFKQVRHARDRAQNYLDTVQSIMIAIDSQGNLTLINPKACQLLGYSEQELLGKNWFDTCLPQENIAEVKDVFQKIIRGETESVEQYENTVRTRSGEQPIIAWHNALMEDRDGKFLGVLSAGEDITARRAAEKRMQTLLDISTRLISENYDHNTLQIVANEVLDKIQGAQAVSVWLHNQQEQTLTVKAATGFKHPAIFELLVENTQGIVGQVTKTREPRLLNDAQNNKDFKALAGITDDMSAIQSLICAPLEFQNKILGVVCVDNFEDPLAFDQQDLVLIESIANQLAGIVENAILFEEVQRSQEELRALSSRLLEVHEKERRAVALDLHDHFGQILTTFKLSLRPEAFIRHSEEEQRARLAQVTAIVDELIEAAEDLSLRLRPSILDDLGVVTAFEWHINRFMRQSNIRVKSNLDIDKKQRYPEIIEITLYRILEEGLSNALQHADPEKIVVDLRQTNDNLTLAIEDDGTGFNLEERNKKLYDHTGLTGMQERVRLVGGTFRIKSDPRKGTRLQVSIPIPEKDENFHGMDT